MSDDLVKRLREYRIGCGIHCSAYDAREPLDECIEAADRIEELELALKHCIRAISEWERKPEGIEPYLLGALDLACKALEWEDEK